MRKAGTEGTRDREAITHLSYGLGTKGLRTTAPTELMDL